MPEVCEVDGISEGEQNVIEELEKMLMEMKNTLDKKQLQTEAEISSPAAQDSSIGEPEGRPAIQGKHENVC
jgi:hypothetical protein